jgi:hypothetical protein
MEVTTLLKPPKLWTRADVLERPCPVPASAGAYAWFFDWCPQGIPPEGLVHSFGFVSTLRGNRTKPSKGVRQIEQPNATEQGPLPLSRERGRFYSTPIARLPFVAELGH